MNELFIALISLSGTVLLALIGLYGARKYNIGPNQDKLVATLQDIIDADKTRIEQLEKADKKNSERISFLESEVLKLNTNLVQILVEKNILEGKLRQYEK